MKLRLPSVVTICLVFPDFTDSYETKENVGNSFIAVVLFNMFVNIYICSKDQVLRLIKKCCKKVK